MMAERTKKLSERLARLAKGRHPLTRLPLHAEAAPVDDRDAPGRRCGNCVFRRTNGRGYPKCHLQVGDIQPYLNHGEITDVRGWWPGCARHEYREDQARD